MGKPKKSSGGAGSGGGGGGKPAAGSMEDPPEQPHNDEGNPGQRAIEREEAREVVSILDVMRDSGGEGGYIRLSVKRAMDLKFNFLNNIPLTTFSEQFVKDTYGGGEYLVEGRRQNGSIVKTLRLNIDLSIPARNPEAKKEEVKAPPIDAAGIVRDVLTQILPMIKPPPAPVQDNTVLVAMINSQASTTAAMFTALVGMNKGGGQDAGTAAAIAKLEGKIERLADRDGGGRDSIDQARKLFELVQMMKDESTPEDKKKGAMAELGEFLGPIAAGLLKQNFAGGVPTIAVSSLDPAKQVAGAPPAFPQPQGETPASAAVNGTTAGATPQPPDRKTSMDFAFYQAMKQFASKAVQSAGLGLSAEAFADAAEDQIPPMYNDKIFAIVSADDWFEKIFASTPGADQQKPWLTELRDIFVEDFGPDQDEEAKP